MRSNKLSRELLGPLDNQGVKSAPKNVKAIAEKLK